MKEPENNLRLFKLFSGSVILTLVIVMVTGHKF